MSQQIRSLAFKEMPPAVRRKIYLGLLWRWAFVLVVGNTLGILINIALAIGVEIVGTIFNFNFAPVQAAIVGNTGILLASLVTLAIFTVSARWILSSRYGDYRIQFVRIDPVASASGH